MGVFYCGVAWVVEINKPLWCGAAAWWEGLGLFIVVFLREFGFLYLYLILNLYA